MKAGLVCCHSSTQFSTGGDLPRDIRQCLKTFLVVTTRRGVTRKQWAETKDTAETPYSIPEILLWFPTKNLDAPNVNSAKAEKSALEVPLSQNCKNQRIRLLILTSQIKHVSIWDLVEQFTSRMTQEQPRINENFKLSFNILKNVKTLVLKVYCRVTKQAQLWKH